MFYSLLRTCRSILRVLGDHVAKTEPYIALWVAIHLTTKFIAVEKKIFSAI